MGASLWRHFPKFFKAVSEQYIATKQRLIFCNFFKIWKFNNPCDPILGSWRHHGRQNCNISRKWSQNQTSLFLILTTLNTYFSPTLEKWRHQRKKINGCDSSFFKVLFSEGVSHIKIKFHKIRCRSITAIILCHCSLYMGQSIQVWIK